MSVTEAARALHAFFSGFGLCAYPQGDVPEAGEEEGVAPYILYPIAAPGFCETVDFPVRVCDRSYGYARAAQTADAICDAVGAGLLLPLPHGALCLRPGESGEAGVQQEREARNLCVHLLLTGYDDGCTSRADARSSAGHRTTDGERVHGTDAKGG